MCHYLLHCSSYTNERLVLLNVKKDIYNTVLELVGSQIVKDPLHGRTFLDVSNNTSLLKATVDFPLETKRFGESLSEVKINGTMASYIFIFQV